MSYSPLNFAASHKKRFIRGCTLILGMGFIGFSLIESNSSETQTLWIVDNSLSMMVEDIATDNDIIDSRLSFAKKIIEKGSTLIPGKQAIMSVAYWAKLEVPMTDNLGVVSDVVNGINPIMRWGGSTISTPLEMIRIIYGDLPNLHIFWLTDGEFSDSGSTYSGKLDTSSITFVGLGTKAGWPIPLGYDAQGKPRYKEVDGQKIISIRDDASLNRVTKTLGANVLFFDSNKDMNLDFIHQKSETSQESLSLYMIIGWLLITIWLMIPRYNYFFK